MTWCHIHMVIRRGVMPKPTFFNLPKKKRDHLIQAATDEFSRVPLNEASIANIVKNADIPRGSFYQYFEDKEDAFYYLLEQKMESHQEDRKSTRLNSSHVAIS